MSEFRTTLENIQEQITARPDALERVLRRQQRKQRNKRIAAGVTALAVAAVGALGIAHGFLFTERRSMPGKPVPGPAAPQPIELQPINTFHTNFPQDIVVAFGSVWTTNEFRDSVTRIDPTTEQVVTIDVGADTRPGSIEAAGNTLWVGGDNAILGIDPTTNTVIHQLPALLRGGVDSLASGFGSIWAATRGGVLRIDPTTGTEIAKIDIVRHGSSIEGISVTTDSVWIGRGTDAVRVDPTTNTVVGMIRDVGPHPDLVSAGGATWVLTGYDIFTAPKPRMARSTLARVDPTTNTVIPGTSIVLIRGGASSGVPLVDGGTIWFPITGGRGPNVGRLYDFDAAAGRIVRTFDLSERHGVGSNAIAFGYGSMWAPSGLTNQVRRFLDPRL